MTTLGTKPEANGLATPRQESEDGLEDARGESVASDFMDLFDGVGLMKDYPHKLVCKVQSGPMLWQPRVESHITCMRRFKRRCSECWD